ncbi:regulator of chromosome condensation 1/beta-lactamase-inhibitor protein II [Chytriomyces sp. MP71]|nr:regulator of chromosome condensation 1/beta-lactamase-inhibitor protein II [Chytriomyces sp. MP71]
MQLQACGSNAQGQLGIGSLEDTPWLQAVSVVEGEFLDAISVALGSNHTLVVTRGGTLLGTGSNACGQLGLSIDGHWTRLRRLALPFTTHQNETTFRAVFSGWNTSFAVDAIGNVWAFGDDSHALLAGAQQPLFANIDAGAGHVTKIAVGLRHALALFSSGRVLVWGDSKLGALGTHVPPSARVDGTTFTRAFKLVLANGCDAFVDIAAGQFHSVVITAADKRQVVVLGNSKKNRVGQLGFAEPGLPAPAITANSTSIIPSSKSEDNLEHVLDLAFLLSPESIPTRVHCGWSHSAIILSSGDCIMWGRNDMGQIPRSMDAVKTSSQTSTCFTTPIVIPALFKTRKMQLASESGIAILSDGRVCSWGWNEHGNCGSGSRNAVFLGVGSDMSSSVSMKGTEGKEIVDAWCGFGHAFISMTVIT